MEKQITTTPAAMPLVTLPEQKLAEFLDIAGVGRELPQEKRRQFIEIAQAYCLNPFKREIYCVSYAGNTSIITGYEVYIKRAERTGLLNGWGVEIKGSGEDMSAIITINRKDWTQPFKHEVYFSEAANRTKDGRLNSTWAKMPKFMLKKVAIAQGFRLCFSDELGGMPYTQDEIEPEAYKKAESAQAVVTAEVAEPEELPLPQDALNALGAAQNKEQLKQICIDIVKVLGDSYKDTLNRYYRQHAGKLGA
ncbi:RecT family recombinase [Candidatus Avelusimicrobium faecicola]|uniref:RecT family recombinase n=1 Tax=Candidatus Avelusimicrobium faecicola TaxID=3416205 RepID=UPI003D0E2B0D